MKKNIIFSIIASFVVSGICLLLNYIYALSLGFLPFGTESSAGGEVIESTGFGVCLQTIYSFGTVEEASTTSIVSLDLSGLLVSFVVLFAIIFVIKTVFHALIKNLP